MKTPITDLILKRLQGGSDAFAYAVSHDLHSRFEGQVVLETTDKDFDLDQFLKHGRAVAFVRDDTHSLAQAHWNRRKKKAEFSLETGALDVSWQGHRFMVVRLDGPWDVHWYLAGTSRAVLEQFFEAVCAFVPSVESQVVVYSQGRFVGDAALAEDLNGHGLEGLVLDKPTEQRLRRATLDFFDQKELFAEHGLPWRRGVLLCGDPGNGKTSAVKALVAAAGKPCVFVRDFAPRRNQCEHPVSEVFARLRAMAPAILVMEDLDTLVHEKNRSVLLNELDGFARNDGILVLATANSPEKLDPALANRPSRFDLRLTFGAPSAALRRRYLAGHVVEWGSMTTQTELVAATRGFSFAHLQELCWGMRLESVLDSRSADAVWPELVEVVRGAGRKKRG